MIDSTVVSYISKHDKYYALEEIMYTLNIDKKNLTEVLENLKARNQVHLHYRDNGDIGSVRLRHVSY